MNKLLRRTILVCASTLLSSQASAKNWIDRRNVEKISRAALFHGMGEAMLERVRKAGSSQLPRTGRELK